jgi:phage portal protein BeeE
MWPPFRSGKLDRDVREDRWNPRRRYNELQASGAATLTSTYGSPDVERILPAFVSYVQEAYQRNGIIFAVQLARMMLFSEAEFIWQDRTSGRLFGNQDLGVLEHPWPAGTSGGLISRVEQDGSLAGNSYTRNIDDARLERLRPDRVIIVSSLEQDRQGRPYRELAGYAYDRNGIGQYEEIYLPNEVAHYAPIPDPCAEFRGMSWLTPVVREIEADQGLTEHKLTYLKHGATPNIVVVYDRVLKPEQIDSIENRIDAKHGGSYNAGKTLVLDQGADPTIAGNSLEQMNFVTVQAAGENRIAAAGGVPGIVVGLKEGLSAATYSNYMHAMRRFADLTARPFWREMCGSIAPIVREPANSRLWFNTRNIAALQAGEKERAEVAQLKAQTAQAWIMAGYEPDSVTAAIAADDETLLVHTGRIPTSLYNDQAPPAPAPQPTPNGAKANA